MENFSLFPAGLWQERGPNSPDKVSMVAMSICKHVEYGGFPGNTNQITVFTMKNLMSVKLQPKC